jgi:hypothetical protein
MKKQKASFKLIAVEVVRVVILNIRLLPGSSG